MTRFIVVFLVVTGAGAIVLACSGRIAPPSVSDAGPADGASAADEGSLDAVADSNDSNDSAVMIRPAEVYGHSSDTLYKLDPDTKAVTVVGKFDGCTGNQVIDIALDESSNMYATTQMPGALYTVDRATAKCTHIADGVYPNSLSFVPKGTLDPTSEALVGYADSTYVRIDTITGTITNVGAIGSGYFSSGDIVSVIGGGTYLTVTGNGCGVPNDCLLEVSPTTGAMVRNLGDVGHAAVFGLAFWAGTAYGFDGAGELFEIAFGAGSVSTSPISIPSAPLGLRFWGAGSTTAAPVGTMPDAGAGD